MFIKCIAGHNSTNTNILNFSIGKFIEKFQFVNTTAIFVQLVSISETQFNATPKKVAQQLSILME